MSKCLKFSEGLVQPMMNHRYVNESDSGMLLCFPPRITAKQDCDGYPAIAEDCYRCAVLRIAHAAVSMPESGFRMQCHIPECSHRISYWLHHRYVLGVKSRARLS